MTSPEMSITLEKKVRCLFKTARHFVLRVPLQVLDTSIHWYRLSQTAPDGVVVNEEGEVVAQGKVEARSENSCIIWQQTGKHEVTVTVIPLGTFTIGGGELKGQKVKTGNKLVLQEDKA